MNGIDEMNILARLNTLESDLRRERAYRIELEDKFNALVLEFAQHKGLQESLPNHVAALTTSNSDLLTRVDAFDELLSKQGEHLALQEKRQAQGYTHQQEQLELGELRLVENLTLIDQVRSQLTGTQRAMTSNIDEVRETLDSHRVVIEKTVATLGELTNKVSDLSTASLGFKKRSEERAKAMEDATKLLADKQAEALKTTVGAYNTLTERVVGLEGMVNAGFELMGAAIQGAVREVDGVKTRLVVLEGAQSVH